MTEVANYAYERVLADSSLNKGNEKNEVKEGHVVAWNKSEDVLSKGLLFGRVQKQEGSDFIVEVSNSDAVIKLPKQRVIQLPQTVPFELVEEEEVKMAKKEVGGLAEEA